ncbi:MAG: transglycosylase domain-containing protein [bacterium]
MSRLADFISRLGYLILGLVALGVVGFILLVAINVNGIPRVPDELNRLIAVSPTEVYAADGSLLTRVGGRRAVPIDRIANSYRLSVLAAEDDDFYHHHGIDKPALVKATWNALHGSKSRGGSTITQQLARNLFFSFEKTYARKFREILATLEIERRFSKGEILAAYCNGIYFGNYAYGIEEAATSYFGIHAANLDLAQASLLAGLPQSPSRFNPYRYPERAAVRQKWILNRLKNLDWVNLEEFRTAAAEPLDFRPLYEAADEGSYFLDAVFDQLEEKYGRTVLYHGGLKIYTTLDPTLQTWAVEGVQEGLADLDTHLGLPRFDPSREEERQNYPQAALVAVEAATGAVQALVGGRDWQASQFNRAIQAQRNMGSVLKPVLYLAAMETLGVQPASLINDDSITVVIPGTNPWSPTNFEPGFRGTTILKIALEKSLNTPAVRLILSVGPESVVKTLQKMQVQSPLVPHYSIALGGTSVSAVELAAIGGSIANLGEVVQPFFVRRIEDDRGQILEEHIASRQAEFDPEVSYMLVDMMKGVISEGTAAGVKDYGFTLPAIGKTGTTDDHRDSWFLGATTQLSVSTWVGFDDYRAMIDVKEEGITGATGAMPIWVHFMQKATEGEPPRDFPMPAGIELVPVNPKTGKRVSERTRGAIFAALPTGVELPDSTLLRIEASWGDTVRVDSLGQVTMNFSDEVLP